MKMLITGSSGLIGSEAVEYFHNLDHEIVGIDNNMRSKFFGPQGDTTWRLHQLQSKTKHFRNFDCDIRNRSLILELFERERFKTIIHCAAQPSHDKAIDIPFIDFEINAVGTLNLLEASRKYSNEAPFIFMSTNKVYGDAPNSISLREKETRWEFSDPSYEEGINENCTIDQSKHSLFGASKVAADILVQEYGRYFDMPTVCIRGGCLTGPQHSGVKLHGFLSYLIKCNLEKKNYTVFGYKGKQVRDNIHSYDVIRFMDEFICSPKAGAVYNIGGGKKNAISILEAFNKVESITSKNMKWKYTDLNREGDHICYYSDLRQAQKEYPKWEITKNLDTIFNEIVEGWNKRYWYSNKMTA